MGSTKQPGKGQPQRILSGIQPTGAVHIGNYLGAIKNWVGLQERDAERLYCIVDLHAITTNPDPKVLRDNIRNMGNVFLAVGLDPQKSSLFIQSEVPEHCELSWILSSCTSMGDLSRMTQFREKSEDKKFVNVGLFSYPVLQAADIVLYKASQVPVGEDQVQHLELTREIVRRFNRIYGDVFPEPQPLLTKAPRIIGLDGEKKMSKSLNNEIGIFETPEQIGKKISGAKTDPARLRKTDPGDPAKCNVFSLHGFFTDEDTKNDLSERCKAATVGCVDCKKILAKNIADTFEPIREKIAALEKDPSYVDDVLAEGAKRAREIANQTMEDVRSKVGLGRAKK